MSDNSPSFPWGKLLLGCAVCVLLFIGGCAALGIFAVKKIAEGPRLIDNQEAVRLIQPLEPKINACAAQSDSLISFGAALEKLELPALVSLEIEGEAGANSKIVVKAKPPASRTSSWWVNGYGSGKFNDLEVLILNKPFTIKSGLKVKVRADFDRLGLSNAAPSAPTAAQ
ncbi:MAG: hypothetical protein RL095_1976 [Verrucomicrobiota bacterium]|jgi:hypothetical protein